MNANADLVVQDLINQIASLSREKVIFCAIAIEKQQEIDRLKREIEKLKKGKAE